MQVAKQALEITPTHLPKIEIEKILLKPLRGLVCGGS